MNKEQTVLILAGNGYEMLKDNDELLDNRLFAMLKLVEYLTFNKDVKINIGKVHIDEKQDFDIIIASYLTEELLEEYKKYGKPIYEFNYEPFENGFFFDRYTDGDGITIKAGINNEGNIPKLKKILGHYLLVKI